YDVAVAPSASCVASVTYHPSCHGMRLLRLGDRQLDLLRTVEGIELTDLPAADQCCGFGGTFSMKNAEVSSAMLADKAANVTATGASLCTGGDASCLLHIGGGLSRTGAAAGTLHLAEILASTHENPYDAGSSFPRDVEVAR
ncbi:MAG TPA: (Fe-S)-binding protein, partial [Arthrobacter sp.]|nr:(Fe-S)-binding protein [Arthrobacter sp.]